MVYRYETLVFHRSYNKKKNNEYKDIEKYQKINITTYK